MYTKKEIDKKFSVNTCEKQSTRKHQRHHDRYDLAEVFLHSSCKVQKTTSEINGKTIH